MAKYSLEFKRAAVDRLVAGESATALARELGILRKFLYQWKSDGRGSARLKKKVDDLERLAGRQSAELDFFVSALRSMKAARPPSGAPTGNGSTV